MKTIYHPENSFVEGDRHPLHFDLLEELMAFEPYVQTFSGSAGSRRKQIKVVAIGSDGAGVDLEQGFLHEYAENHRSNDEWEAPSVGAQIANLNVKALRLTKTHSCSWSDDPDEWDQVLIELAPLDWVKIRRRVEDRLRKDRELLMRVALLVKINLI